MNKIMNKIINKIAEQIELLDAVISRASGYFYAYRVQFSYKNKRGVELFNWTQFVGLSSRAYINDFRGMKVNNCKVLNDDKFKSLRPKLCNGTIDMDILAYVGRINLHSQKKL